MKYKVGDKVKIKSFDWWYINNVFDDNNGEKCISCGNYIFIRDMTDYCGKIVTIEVVNESKGYYKIFEDEKHWYWTDEMIECKVEEDFREVVDEYYFDMLGGKSVKEITTIDKAAKVFAEMLVLIGNGTEHGLGRAKEWENEFRKRLEE